MNNLTTNGTTRGAMLAAELERLGTLALAAGKDFNDELTFILNDAAVSMDSLESGHPAGPRLAELRQSAMRCAEITRCLTMVTMRAKQSLHEAALQ